MSRLNLNRENRLRRKALRLGLRMSKARSLVEAGHSYSLVDENNFLVLGQTQGEPSAATIDEIEAFLQRASAS